MISHLMIDVDGVVITGRPSDGLSWETDLLTDLGVSPDTIIMHFFKPYWSRIVTGELAMRPTLDDVLKQHAPQVSPEQFLAYWFTQDARRNEHVLVALDTQRAKGRTVWFATNQEPLRAAYLWSELGLQRHADRLIHSADVGTAKPDKAFFQSIMSATGARPDAHLFIDDSLENVEAARQLGWQGHHWTGRESADDVFMRFGLIE